MKMSVLYHTKTGNTKRMADVIVEGMESINGVEAKSFSIDEIDSDWVKESSCIVLGTPTYMASVSAAVKTWLDGPASKYGLSGKIGGAFATSDYLHGGGILAIQTIIDHMMVFGMLTYSEYPGAAEPPVRCGESHHSGQTEPPV